MKNFSVAAIALLCLVVWGLVDAIEKMEDRIEKQQEQIFLINDENLHLKVQLERERGKNE